MPRNHAHAPTADEIRDQSLISYRGIELGLGQADHMAKVSARLENQYPGHLIVVQAGNFLHCYNRSAYALSQLKKYKLMLAGTATEPHLRSGFPIGNYKKRLWPMIKDFKIPYVVYLGNRTDGYQAIVSSGATTNAAVLQAVSDQIVHDVIADLVERGRVNQSSTAKMLANPDSTGFNLKTQAEDLATNLLHDVIKMPRELRTTFGENLRSSAEKLMRCIYQFGMSANKGAVLAVMSAEIDLIKFYIMQAPQLKALKKFPFDARAGLAAELGRLVGGMIKKTATVAP